MCNPMIFAVASTVFSMASQYVSYRQESKAQQAAANYNAQIAANEKEVQQKLAQNELARGAAERERVIRAGARHQGEMRSMLGASGFEMDSGSGLSLLGESAEEIQYDANIVSQNAAMAAWQHEAGAVKAGNEQNWQLYQGQQSKGSRTAQWLGMGGSLLGGIGKGISQSG